MYPYSSTSQLYVPIDFGKNVNWYTARQGPDLERVWPDRKVYNDRRGYVRLAQDLATVLEGGAYRPIQVGYEPTGIYHEAWVQALQSDFGSRVVVRQVHPTTSHARRQVLQQGRSRKSDQIDLEALSYCLRDGQSSPAPYLTREDLRFEVWASTYQQLHGEANRQKQRLGAQLDRLWPGMLLDVERFRQAHPDLEPPEPLLRSRPWERSLLRAILLHRPNPQDWCSLSPAQIQALMRQYTGRCGPYTLNKIQSILARGLYLPADLAELLAERLRLDFQVFLDLQQRLSDLEVVAEELVEHSQAAVLTTIPGMSAVLAARYIGQIGPIGRFTSPAQIWAFAGCEPTLNDSGDHRGQVSLSHKGAPSLRDTLYLIGFHTAKRCPAIRRAQQRALTHGKGRVGAVLHAAHKANRMCFHLYTTQQPYDPRRAG
jgi:transposase